MNGLLDHLLQIGADLLANIESPAEHWADELRAEKRQMLLTMVWVGITFLFGVMAFLLLTALALVLLPAHLRIQGLVLLTGFYLAAFIALALCLRRRINRPARLPVTSAVVFSAQILASLLRLARHKTAPHQSS